MRAKLKVGVITLLMNLLMIDQAFAGSGHWFHHHHSVPEIDGPGSVAALALLVSIVVILYASARK